MNDIKLPKILEYYKTKTLDKGRVETSLHLFMIDAEVFDNIVLAFIRGESKVVECRHGVAVKHPKDKYDKTIAKQEAYKKLKKQRVSIRRIAAFETGTHIHLDNLLTISKYGDKVIVE